MVFDKAINDRVSQLEDLIRNRPVFDVSLYEKYRDQILKLAKEGYDAVLELMDYDHADDEVIEARQLYKRILGQPVSECEDEITGYLCEMYYAVDGEPDRYYGADCEETKLLRALMLKGE